MAYKVIDVADHEWYLTPRERYPIPEQHGPLKQYDREMRCACRGCGSSTFYKVYGIPRCTTHALRELNYRLYEMGEDANS